MKRLIISLMISTFLISNIIACNNISNTTMQNLNSISSNSSTNSSTPNDSSKLKVITTIFPQYDFARQIGGDKVDVTMLLKPGAESHSYEPSPQDIKNIQASDLFIYVGSENDVWVDNILSSMGDNAPYSIRLIDIVHTYDEELLEGMEHYHDDHDGDHDHDDDHYDDKDHDHDDDKDHDHDDDKDHDHDDDKDHDHDDDKDHDHDDDKDDHGHDNDKDYDHDKDHDDYDDDHDHGYEIDEHVWTSPKNAIIIVQKMMDLFIELMPANKEIYETNGMSYLSQLKELDNSYMTMISNSKRDEILFGDRFPFRYLAEDYDLDYYAAFSGCSTETEADASTVAYLIDKVKEEGLPCVFTIEFSNGKIADSIADATDTKKLMLHSCHNVSKDELESGATYISIMQNNLNTLKIALND